MRCLIGLKYLKQYSGSSIYWGSIPLPPVSMLLLALGYLSSWYLEGSSQFLRACLFLTHKKFIQAILSNHRKTKDLSLL